MGTSFGAVAALSTAARFADTYGSLLLQSGSFLFSDPVVWHGESAAFDPVVRFIDRYRASPYARYTGRSSPAGRTRTWSPRTAQCSRSFAVPE